MAETDVTERLEDAPADDALGGSVAEVGPESRSAGTGYDGSTSSDTEVALSHSRPKRLLTSAFIIVVLIGTAVSVMPRSQTRNDLLPGVAPVMNALGLDQAWGVFSPDPRNDTSHIVARIDFTDGSTIDRTIEASAGLGEYRDYRWRKYEEQLWLGQGNSQYWLPYARWLTTPDKIDGRTARQVTIIRQTRLSLPPGPGPDYGPWQEFVLGRVTGDQ